MQFPIQHARTMRRRTIVLLVTIAIGFVGASDRLVHADDAARDGGERPPGTIEFTGRNFFGKAEGTFHRWRVVEAEVDPANLVAARVVVEVDLASVDTGIERRDDHLRSSDFFEVDRFATARVEVNGLASAAAMPDDDGPAFEATFRIDLHGVTYEVEGRVVLANASPPTFAGELVVDRTQFGVGAPPSRWNPMSIDAEIPVRFRYRAEANR